MEISAKVESGNRPVDLETFDPFPRLAPELRICIWQHALAIQIQEVTSTLPRWLSSQWAERRRQAIVGPRAEQERMPLKVHIRDPYRGQKLRFAEDEFETLVHSFSLSAVCIEARQQLADYWRRRITIIEFKYTPFELWSLKPPRAGDAPIVLRDVHWNPRAHMPEHIHPAPTELILIDPAHFESAEHLVALVTRFFSDKIKNLILQSTTSSHEVGKAYWPRRGKVPSSIIVKSSDPSQLDDIYIPVEQDGRAQVPSSIWAVANGRNTSMRGAKKEDSPSCIRVSEDGQAKVPDRFWANDVEDVSLMTDHLMCMFDLYTAACTRLPALEQIEVHLKRQLFNGSNRTQFKIRWVREC
ncbi:hypothetical protein ANO11243_010040 [Dothideomycetidae sp. 11243]|nr:hypothetical protein ANO11243_010040 [fungal sp. No.11243]